MAKWNLPSRLNARRIETFYVWQRKGVAWQEGRRRTAPSWSLKRLHQVQLFFTPPPAAQGTGLFSRFNNVLQCLKVRFCLREENESDQVFLLKERGRGIKQMAKIGGFIFLQNVKGKFMSTNENTPKL